ncbi:MULTISPECIES: transposase [unclassified Streptomyces]|uniref:transposase n=1 Tax=unclassified Streptomyces TaxID=2593676 RepID=UPI00224CB8A3|nr:MULTISPECIES: transposase [unclassified Streptomyces]MCX5287069.1 transposase [Streptomyces sp. NBC_00183]
MDNLSSHNSVSTRTWLEDHPSIKHVFIPVGACWLNLQEGWWRIFRTALAGRSFGDRDDVIHATGVATDQQPRPALRGQQPRRPRPARRIRRRQGHVDESPASAAVAVVTTECLSSRHHAHQAPLDKIQWGLQVGAQPHRQCRRHRQNERWAPLGQEELQPLHS